MDKLLIRCKGNANEVLKVPEESLAKYLWDNDIEVTHIHNTVENGVNTILFYGYEGVEGLIKKVLNKKRKDNLYDFLHEYDLQDLKINHEQCDEQEIMQFIL